MNLKDYECEGQMSLFDLFDMPCGRMSQEHSPQTVETISELSWKNLLRSKSQTLLCLDARNGAKQDLLSETLGVSHGDSSMHSIGVFHNEERELPYLWIGGGRQQETFYFLSHSEEPIVPIKTKLSWVLEEQTEKKYNLSVRACEGILSRASRRGKALPEILKTALEQVIHSSSDTQEVSVEGGGSGPLVQDNLSATLSCNQDQTLFHSVDLTNHTVGGELNGTLQSSAAHNTHSNNVVLSLTKTNGMMCPAKDMANTLVESDYKDPPIVMSDVHATLSHEDGVGGGTLSNDEESGAEFCYWNGQQTADTLTRSNADGSQRMPDKDNFNGIISIDRKKVF